MSLRSPPPPRPPAGMPVATRERAATVAMTGAVPPPMPMPVPTAAPPRPPTRSTTGPGRMTGPGKRCPTCGDRFPLDYRVCPRDAIELVVEADDERDEYVGT